MRRALPIALWAALGCGSPPPTGAAPAPARPPAPPPSEAVVLVGGAVHTLDPDRPTARGLRIEDGRITHLFDEPEPALDGRRIDLAGAAILPGPTDAHLHLRSLGAAARQLDLRGTASAAEVAERVRAAAAEAPAGTWIRGRGWDQNDWPGQAFPSHRILDEAAPEHPVWLTRVDGHAVWVNARALELAGVTARTPDPEGGEILRGPGRRPTGVLIDNAIDLVERELPPATFEEIRADLESGIGLCLRAGLAGVHDMGTTPAVLRELRALETEGALPIRVYAYLGGGWEDIEPLLAESPDREGRLQVVGVKLFADGALGSRGAALLEPYADRPQTRGLLVTPPEELARRARTVHDAGYQLAIHAIGDRGNRVALDAIAAAQGDDRSRHHRIEHAQVVAPDDFARFAELGVVASMQPTHATSDMPWAEARLGPERITGAYAWRTMRRHGVLLALGSDAPVEEESPWLGIYAAVTRRDPEGHPEPGWYPEQRLTLEEALAGFTSGPAAAVGAEGGVLRPGAPADLVIVRPDPFAVPAAELTDVAVERVVVEGEPVWPES